MSSQNTIKGLFVALTSSITGTISLTSVILSETTRTRGYSSSTTLSGPNYLPSSSSVKRSETNPLSITIPFTNANLVKPFGLSVILTTPSRPTIANV